jgi:hypothetical protein
MRSEFPFCGSQDDSFEDAREHTWTHIWIRLIINEILFGHLLKFVTNLFIFSALFDKMKNKRKQGNLVSMRSKRLFLRRNGLLKILFLNSALW